MVDHHKPLRKNIKWNPLIRTLKGHAELSAFSRLIQEKMTFFFGTKITARYQQVSVEGGSTK